MARIIMVRTYTRKNRYRHAERNLPRRWLLLRNPEAQRFQRATVAFPLHRELEDVDGTALDDLRRLHNGRDHDEDTSDDEIDRQTARIRQEVIRAYSARHPAQSLPQQQPQRRRQHH